MIRSPTQGTTKRITILLRFLNVVSERPKRRTGQTSKGLLYAGLAQSIAYRSILRLSSRLCSPSPFPFPFISLYPHHFNPNASPTDTTPGVAVICGRVHSAHLLPPQQPSGRQSGTPPSLRWPRTCADRNRFFRRSSLDNGRGRHLVLFSCTPVTTARQKQRSSRICAIAYPSLFYFFIFCFFFVYVGRLLLFTERHFPEDHCVFRVLLICFLLFLLTHWRL